jgi:hypothetical protein
VPVRKLPLQRFASIVQEIGGGILLSEIKGKVIECKWVRIPCGPAVPVQMWLLCTAVVSVQDAEWTTLIPHQDGKTWADDATFRQGGWYPADVIRPFRAPLACTHDHEHATLAARRPFGVCELMSSPFGVYP